MNNETNSPNFGFLFISTVALCRVCTLIHLNSFPRDFMSSFWFGFESAKQIESNDPLSVDTFEMERYITSTRFWYSAKRNIFHFWSEQFWSKFDDVAVAIILWYWNGGHGIRMWVWENEIKTTERKRDGLTFVIIGSLLGTLGADKSVYR